MTKVIVAIYAFFEKRRPLALTLLCLSFLLFAYGASGIRFEENIFSFLPKDKADADIGLVSEQLAGNNKWILMFSFAQPVTPDRADYKLLTAVAEETMDFISSQDSTGCFGTPFYKVDADQMTEVMSTLGNCIPLFLDDADYAKMDSLFTTSDPALMLARMEQTLRENKSILASPASAMLSGWYRQDPFHLSGPALLRLKDLQPGGQYPVMEDGLFTRDSLTMLAFVPGLLPVGDTHLNDAAVNLMEAACGHAAAQSEYKVEMTYFAASAVAVANARRIKADTIWLLFISITVICILLYVFFRTVTPILLIGFPVVYGGLFALACMYLFKGRISSIAVGAMSAIMGIALNYSLHYLIHARTVTSAKRNLEEITFPMVTGCVTTVGAFFSLFFIRAESLRDFGLLAALSITGAIVFVLVFMPHISHSVLDGKGKRTRGPGWVYKLAAYRPERYRWAIPAMLAVTVFLAFFVRRTGFDVDMHHINYMGPRQTEAMALLTSGTHEMDDVYYLVSRGENPDKALYAHEKALPFLDSMSRLPEKPVVSGVGSFLPSSARRAAQLDRWYAFWAARPQFSENLISVGSRLGYKAAYFQPFLSLLDPAQAEVLMTNPLEEFGKMSDAYIIRTPDKTMVLDMVYAGEAVSVKKELERSDTALEDSFLYDENRLADALINLLNREFHFVLLVCSVLVFGFLLLSFRSWAVTVLCFLPMAVGWVWILGIMGLTGMRFNIVNVILATFIFGLGDDYSVFVMEGMLYEYKYGKPMLASYKTALLLSALILLVALGSLLFARHPAMHSLGAVSVIGMLSVITVSYTVSPAIFKWMLYKHGKKRRVPVCISNLMRSLLVGLFFVGGTIYMHLYMLGCKAVYGGNRAALQGSERAQRGKAKLHERIQGMMAWFVRHFPGTPCRLEAASPASSDRAVPAGPAIWIANHQSHLDLMYLLALHPKVVALTNHWVWHAPLYGALIRYLDFVPVADQGIETSLPTLKNMVDRGYSILVFPEGTRAEAEGKLARFHTGAFYLAQALDLPVIPITLVGPGFVMPKKEPLILRSMVTLHIGLPIRIGTNEDTAVSAIRSAAVAARRQMQTNYDGIRAGMAWPFYRDLIKGKYLYKDEDWRKCKQTFREGHREVYENVGL